MTEEMVRLTVVPSELEADQVCGLLETEGIDCFQRLTDVGVGWAPGMTGAGGAREVLVKPADLERARELLEAPVAEDEPEQ